MAKKMPTTSPVHMQYMHNPKTGLTEMVEPMVKLISPPQEIGREIASPSFHGEIPDRSPWPYCLR